MRKEYKEYWAYWHKYQWILGLKGRRKYFLLGFMLSITIHLLSFIGLLFTDKPILPTIIMMMGGMHLFLNLLLSMHLRYWRDVIIWAWGNFGLLAEIFIVGFALLFKNGQLSILVFVTVLISIFLSLREWKRGSEQLELLQRTGLLKHCLDEENWVYDDDNVKNANMMLDLIKYERRDVHYTNWLKQLKRLEKLHYLIPGLMISFRRAFGYEETILSILLLTFGLFLLNSLITGRVGISAYLKIREWEREKGKPILLRFAWEREQMQRNRKPNG